MLDFVPMDLEIPDCDACGKPDVTRFKVCLSGDEYNPVTLHVRPICFSFLSL